MIGETGARRQRDGLEHGEEPSGRRGERLHFKELRARRVLAQHGEEPVGERELRVDVVGDGAIVETGCWRAAGGGASTLHEATDPYWRRSSLSEADRNAMEELKAAGKYEYQSDVAKTHQAPRARRGGGPRCSRQARAHVRGAAGRKGGAATGRQKHHDRRMRFPR